MFFNVDDDVAGVLLFDAGVALMFIAFSTIADRERLADKILFGSVTIVSLVLYISWRWLDTLPDLEMTGSSLWAHFYFAFETVSVVYALGSVFILFRMSDWASEADDAQEQLKARGTYPSVDVFICTYNEPINILEKSVISAKSMDYPRFNVYVCDDTRRPEIHAYCSQVGVNYITRPDNRHAKAGNLNNALKRTNLTDNPSDLIMILDADFAPQEDFLMRVVGLFRNDEIGLVQTPQFYFNSDPIQHNLGIRSSFVDDQRVFFDTFQPAKDAAGCAFCVGTSFVVRRSLLNKMGGFPHEALSEDMLLTYRLMERGYVTRWLNEKLSVGLSAEGIPEYITQRTRWCLGTIQIGLLKDGPLWRGRFTLTQRLHYLHGLLSWLSKPFILCMLFAPSIYWLFDVTAIQADEIVFMKYGISALFVFWSDPSWISGRRTFTVIHGSDTRDNCTACHDHSLPSHSQTLWAAFQGNQEGWRQMPRYGFIPPPLFSSVWSHCCLHFRWCRRYSSGVRQVEFSGARLYEPSLVGIFYAHRIRQSSGLHRTAKIWTGGAHQRSHAIIIPFRWHDMRRSISMRYRRRMC